MNKISRVAAVGLFALGMIAPASAADMRMPVKAPPPIPVQIFTWTGFYLGGNIGAAWSSNRISEDRFGVTWNRSSDARFIGGGQIGYNWQFNTFVFGIEGDIDGILNKSRSNNVLVVPTVGPVAVAGHGGGNWVSTLAARFGWAVDRTLFYGKAGYGWANGSGSATVTNLTTGASYAIGGDGTRSGWLVGGGIEYAFAPNWTVKGEYNYLNTGKSRTFFVPATGTFLAGDVFHSGGRDIQMVKFGFNYLFR
jgi:outer membrane immunogenic protein